MKLAQVPIALGEQEILVNAAKAIFESALVSELLRRSNKGCSAAGLPILANETIAMLVNWEYFLFEDSIDGNKVQIRNSALKAFGDEG